MSSTSQAQAEKPWPACVERRIGMTVSCRDADPIPKVASAGEIFERGGQRLQLMHEGTVVKADGYGGPWVTEIIRRLQGHHEPQEELLFHHLLAHCRPGSRMMEVGAFWAYYTCWFLRTVPRATAICLEPDSANAECGRENLRLNSLKAKWIRGLAGRHYIPNAAFRQESDQMLVEIPCHNFSSLLDEAGAGPVELLHIDGQGAELPFLESLGDNDLYRQVRFVVVSTHHESISDSPKTHEECVKVIQRLSGRILEEHSVEESFSGDGLIVASFDPRDKDLKLPKISRNSVKKSLFGFPPPPGGEVNLIATESQPRSDTLTPSLPSLRRVGIDLMPMLPGGHNGGAKIFVVELIRQMAQHSPDVEFILFFKEAEKFLDVFPRASNIRLVSMGKKDCIPESILATGLGPQADVLFCPFSAVLLQASGVPVVSTFYDAQFRDYPRFFSAEERKQREANHLRMLGSADGIASISDFGRDSILEKKEYPADRIQTIHLHLAGRGGLATDGRPLPGGLRAGRYFFYPANFWRHKNHEALLTAFGMACRQSLPQDILLALTGAEDERTEKVRQAVRIMGLESRIRFLGFLPDEDLASVLRQSLALFFPSLYEGFGIPVVEAQAAGVPVACSRAGSLAEVAGESALFFNPKKPKEMAEVMNCLARDEKLRSSLILRGHKNVQRFSDPKGMAKAYLGFFQQIASRPRNKVMLQGIFPDRWAGRKVKITNHNTYSVVVELTVVQPDWLHRGVLWCGVKKQPWALRFWRRVKQNKPLVMKVRLKAGREVDFKFGPCENPPDAAKNGEMRKLSCMVLQCGLVKASGSESLLGQIEL